jgi:hypothetical protein
MKMSLKILLALIVLNSCGNDSSGLKMKNSTPVDSVANGHPDYETFKSSIRKKKSDLVGNNSSQDASDYLYNLLNNDIYFYWKGTPWDFNGDTQKPGEGSIACGYFVTNTLVDLGFKIQRLKLAQAVSSEMINTLCTDIHRFTAFEKLQKYLIGQQGQGVFIIGLDFHTGYILKDSLGSYFLHSNYIYGEGVVKEKTGESPALKNNKTFMIGSLSGNKEILKKWLHE